MQLSNCTSWLGLHTQQIVITNHTVCVPDAQAWCLAKHSGFGRCGVGQCVSQMHLSMVCCSLANDLTVLMPDNTSCAVAEAAAAADSWLVTYFLFKPGTAEAKAQ